MEKAEIIERIERMKKTLELKEMSNSCGDGVRLRDAMMKIIISRWKRHYGLKEDELNQCILYLESK